MTSNNPSVFEVVQILYWLALSTWFGGALFIALAAPVIFRVVREQRPMLPTVLSVNLENQHADLMAGSIVASLLQMLGRIQTFCAAGVFIGLLGQWVYTRGGGPSALWQLILRSTLFVIAAGLLAYDRRVVWPAMNRHREQYLDHADEPDVANPAKDEFDRLHRESVMLLTFRLALLLGLILFSVTIRARAAEIVFPT